jgi:anti-sigma factor RsiW
MTSQEHTLIGPYVLDAVTDLERAAVDRHLRECDSCRAEVDELREASAKLADGAWSVPPPRLRDNVLAAIASTRQVAPISPAAPAVAATARRSRLRLVSAAAAVVVAAAGAGSVVYVVQDQRVRQEQANVTAARATENLTRAVLDSPDLVLREERLTTGGRVTVASSKLQNAGVIMLAADAAPTDGKVYQLWTIREQGPTPEGSMAPGQASAVQLVRGLPEADGVGVTVEPGPGATRPTTLVADVSLA